MEPIQFFMIAAIMFFFMFVLAGVNRRWRWVLGAAAGITVSVASALYYS